MSGLLRRSKPCGLLGKSQGIPSGKKLQQVPAWHTCDAGRTQQQVMRKRIAGKEAASLICVAVEKLEPALLAALVQRLTTTKLEAPTLFVPRWNEKE
jgi:hypothetical protein